MFGYLVLTHPIGADGQFVKQAHPVLGKLIRRISAGESYGMYGLLSSQPTKASSNTWEYAGRSELPYHVELVEEPQAEGAVKDLLPMWADDDLGVLPGSFGCASIVPQLGHCGLFQGKPRTVSMATSADAGELSAAVDGHTIDPLPAQMALHHRLGPVLDTADVGGGVCLVLAPSTLLLNPGTNSVKLCLFVVWIAGSLFLLWHDNPLLVVDAINSLNGDREAIPHVSNTIGYSLIALHGTLHINYNLYLKHIIRDMSRAGQHSMRMSTVIARTIYRINKGVHQ